MTHKIEKETKKSLCSMRSEIDRNFSPYLRENVRVHISERPSIYLIFVRTLHQIKREIEVINSHYNVKTYPNIKIIKK